MTKSRLVAPAAGSAAPRLHTAIARRLGMAILSGRLAPGHLLEGEIEASEGLGVSRGAYREAIRILAAPRLSAMESGITLRSLSRT